MSKFKIFGYTNLVEGREREQEITVTDSENLSPASTFDENFTIAKHDKISLTFSILEKLPDGSQNPFFDLFKPEAVVGLQLLDRQKNTEAETEKRGAFYRLKVTQRSPAFKRDNKIYSITCEDYASRVYSRQGEGLSLETTGTLREIAEQILGETRKNNLYKDLNKDISEISYFLSHEQEKYGFEYALPYVNCEVNRSGINSYFRGNNLKPYVSFIPTENFTKGSKYDLSFDLIDARSHFNRGDFNNLRVRFQVKGRTLLNGQESIGFAGSIADVDFTGKSVNVRVPFVYNFLNNEQLISIDLYLMEEPGSLWANADKYSFSLSNLKISRNKEHLKEDKNLESLFLNKVDNEDIAKNFTSDFSNYHKLVKKYGENGFNKNSISETRMTYSISNSNLYGSLTSLAELFDGEVKFDYLDNGFHFTKNNLGEYKGFRLHPEINLSSISRPETSEDFATILHIEGSGDVNGIVPGLPKEWRMFFTEAYSKWFDKNGNFISLPAGSEDNYFINYKKDGYQKLSPLVYSFISSADNYRERVEEINKFAEQLDKVPNFENTVYNIKYFKDVGMIDKQAYEKFNNIIYNNIRKLNIALNINSYKYWSVYSSFLTQLQELAFYLSAINTEQQFQNKSEAKEFKKYTSSWVAQINNLNASKAAEAELKEDVLGLLGLTERDDGSGFGLSLETGDFVYNALLLFGYENNQKNGVRDIVQKNREKLDELTEKRRGLRDKRKELVSKINSGSTSRFVKENLEVELAGVKNDLRRIETFLGRDLSDEESFAGQGIYFLESFYYSLILKELPKSKEALPVGLQNNSSLYDLLFNRDSDFNLNNKKEMELASVLNEYEPFALEARYQNSDVVTPEGLLDQALIAFATFSRPKVTYNISTINIGAIEGYEFYEHPEIGDKILLDDDLYLNYQDEETNFLVITEYSENLRDPASLTLGVETDDESELLVRRMLEQTNFVTIGEAGVKQGLTNQIPQEFSSSAREFLEAEEIVKNSELSIAEYITR